MTGALKPEGYMGAVLSDDRKHRYWLWRRWAWSLPMLVVVMFNPSTADEKKDDLTVQRLCKWAKRWGYGGILIINLNSHRSSDPRALWGMAEVRRRGDGQEAAVREALDIARQQGTPVLAAWGDLASDADIAPMVEQIGTLNLICLGTNASGSPKHPMARGKARIPDDQEPLPFRLTP